VHTLRRCVAATGLILMSSSALPAVAVTTIHAFSAYPPGTTVNADGANLARHSSKIPPATCTALR
jgi:hypothetical protein